MSSFRDDKWISKGLAGICKALFCILPSFGLCQQAVAQVPERLVVFLDSALDVRASSASWQDACTSLAESMEVNKGAYGLGVFQSHSCHLSAEEAGRSNEAWYAKVSIAVDSTRIRIYRSFELAGSGGKALAEFAFPFGDYAFEILSDQDVASLIGYSLLDQMPAMIRVTTDNFENGRLATNRALNIDDLDVPPPPETLVFYTLAYDQARSVWDPEYLGEGRSAVVSGQRKRLHEKALDEPPVWESGVTFSTSGDVFGHDRAGRKTRVSKLNSQLKALIASLKSDLDAGAMAQTASAFGSFFASLGSSGYLGLRYGLPVLPGPLISKSTFFGALAEIRSGILDGLKVYYDFWPEVEDEINGLNASFGGERFILGYSLGIDFNSFVTGIDVTPKAGAWTFAAKYPFETSEKQWELLEFKVEKAPSLELELGIESSAYWYILRGWASRALSTSLSANQASVVNTRAGLDLMIRGPSFSEASNINISFLMFTFSEHVILRRSKAAREAELGRAIDKLEYNQTYFGGGFAISW